MSCERRELSFRSRRIVGVELDQHAVRTAAVHISGTNALEAREATDLNVLADDKNLFLQRGFYRLLAQLAGHQSLHVGGILRHDNVCNFFYKGLETVVFRNKVGLGVYFDDNAHLVCHVGRSVDHALSGNAACLFRGGGKTLFAQILDSLVKIAVRLGERLFAVHHAAAGLLAQLLNI